MIRIQTPSRLHFGLIAPAAKVGRRFGGAGLMIDQPGIEVTLRPAQAWTIRGAFPERANMILNVLQRSKLRDWLRPHEVLIKSEVPEHVGLGSGTQLALAMARGISKAVGAKVNSVPALASIVNRGVRSAIGTHGFDHGGFLVDAGKEITELKELAPGHVAPLICRLRFPEEWRIVLILTPCGQGMHGMEERQAFNKLQELPGRPEVLCRLLLMEVLPALAHSDFPFFSESLHQFNRLAGEAFASIQGGAYASPRVEERISHLRELGVKGVGQSSWGPAVFAIAEDEGQAGWIERQVQKRFEFPDKQVQIVRANDRGAEILHEPAP